MSDQPGAGLPGCFGIASNMDEKRIGPALGKIASGLYIATGRVGDEPVGMLCSFVEQASFDPPLISLAIALGRPISPVLEGRETFGLHVLSKDNNALLKSFARGGTRESFAAHEMVPNAFGVPQFAEAWAFLAARVVNSMPAGDHVLYLAEVLDGALQHDGRDASVRIRPNGFTY